MLMDKFSYPNSALQDGSAPVIPLPHAFHVRGPHAGPGVFSQIPQYESD